MEKSVTGPDPVRTGTRAQEIRALRDEGELRALWQYGCVLYGENQVPFEVYRDWWSTYPNGIYVLSDGATIGGYLAVWPLKRETFDAIQTGRMRERDLRGSHFHVSASPVATWYISGLALRPELRRTTAIQLFLREVFLSWVESSPLAESVTLGGLAASPEGEAILHRFGFRQVRSAEETPDRCSMYVLEAESRTAFDRVLDRLLPRHVPFVVRATTTPAIES